MDRKDVLKTGLAAVLGWHLRPEPGLNLRPKIEVPHVNVQGLDVGLLDFEGNEIAASWYARQRCSMWRWNGGRYTNAARVDFAEASSSHRIGGMALWRPDGTLVARCRLTNSVVVCSGDLLSFMPDNINLDV